MGKDTNDRKVMPLSEWPEIDRQCWNDALASGDDDENPAVGWADETTLKVKLAYGRLLQWLHNADQLDTAAHPRARLTKAIIIEFIPMLTANLAPHSAAMIVASLCDAARAMVPDQDWIWLRKKSRTLGRNAGSVRDPASGRIDPGDIYRLGLKIMDEIGSKPITRQHLAKFGEGLFITLVTVVPAFRRRALRSLRVSDLARMSKHYELTIRDITKKVQHKSSTYSLPGELTPYIDSYINLHRPRLLQGRPETDILLLTGTGRSYPGNYMWARMVSHTGPAFGVKVGTHRVRHCAATAIATKTPAAALDAQHILDHATPNTTQKFYNLGQGLEATRRFQGAMLELVAKAEADDD